MNLLFPTKKSHILNMSLEPQWYFSSPVLSDISIFADLMQRNVVVTASHKTYSKYVSGTSLLLL